MNTPFSSMVTVPPLTLVTGVVNAGASPSGSVTVTDPMTCPVTGSALPTEPTPADSGVLSGSRVTTTSTSAVPP